MTRKISKTSCVRHMWTGICHIGHLRAGICSVRHLRAAACLQVLKPEQEKYDKKERGAKQQLFCQGRRNQTVV